MIKKLIYSWLVLWLVLFIIGNLPVFSSWMKNQTQSYAQDLILPLLLSSLNSLIVSLFFAKRFNKNRFATLIGVIPVIVVFGQNYQNSLSKLNPGLEQNSNFGIIFSLAISLLIISLALLISFLIDKYTAAWRQITLVLGEAIIISIVAAFAIQLIFVAPAIISRWPEYFYRPPGFALTANSNNVKPDIYYIILDRYASQNILQEQFQSDNADFLNYLKSNNFSTNPSALSNYPFTAMSIASTLSANYDSDLIQKFSNSKMQTMSPYYDTIKNSPVISQLKKLGYSYDLLGTWYEATNQSPLADNVYQPEGRLTVFGRTYTLNGFPKMVLTNSFWEQIVRHGLTIGQKKILGYSGISEADATPYKLDKLKKLADQPAGGRFIFAHILVPHDPYYFNADGSRLNNPGSNDVEEPIKQKYIGQVEYINTQMKDVINRIEKNSNRQAIIVLQADEGPYPTQLQLDDASSGSIIDDDLSTIDMRTWSDQNLKMKYGILAAYQVPQAKSKDLASGGDSVNIFRLIFNTYFNTSMSYLPRCYYALTNGRNLPFAYSDITNRLTGQSNSECSPNSDF